MSETRAIVDAGYGSTQNDMESGLAGLRMEVSHGFALLRHKYLAQISFHGCVAVFFGWTPIAVLMFLELNWFSEWYAKHWFWIHAVVNGSNSIVFYIMLGCGLRLKPMFDALRVNEMVGNVLVCFNSGMLFGMEGVDTVDVCLKTNGLEGMCAESWVFTAMTLIALLASLMVTLNVLHLIYYQRLYLRVLRDLHRRYPEAPQ